MSTRYALLIMGFNLPASHVLPWLSSNISKSGVCFDIHLQDKVRVLTSHLKYKLTQKLSDLTSNNFRFDKSRDKFPDKT